MRFNCDYLKERRAQKAARVSEWHKFFTLWPRKVGDRDCRWFETIERRYHYNPSRRGPEVYYIGYSEWQYRSIP